MPTALKVKEKPILFSGPMVKAILAGEKTQTRRIVRGADHGSHVTGLVERGGKWQHQFNNAPPGSEVAKKWPGGLIEIVNLKCPYEIGMPLWVRETWRPKGVDTPLSTCTGPEDISFAADADEAEWATSKWRSPIFMPRWASRITLKVTEVKAERLQDISKEDAIAEGTLAYLDYLHQFPKKYDRAMNTACRLAKQAGETHSAPIQFQFAALWDSINGKKQGHDWDSNPWVFVISFKRI